MDSFIAQVTPAQLMIVGLLGAILIGTVLWLAGRTSFSRVDIMTPNEVEFYNRLVEALPHLNIWPQVPLLALLEPKGLRRNGHMQSAFRMISNRRVDWVIAQNHVPLLVIELDDRTHNRRADRRRDKILNSCGYPVLRYESRLKPTPNTIADDVKKYRNQAAVHRL